MPELNMSHTKTEYEIGFRSFWTTDPARSYRTAFDDGATYGGTTPFLFPVPSP